MNETVGALLQAGPQRRAWVKATGNLTRQIKAVERRGKEGEFTPEMVDAITLPLHAALAAIKPSRDNIEKEMAKAAKSLALNEFVESINGFGYFGLALIVSEAGDLSNYANPGKLWKRMGLAVFNGKSQRRVKDAEEAIEQGYNPVRRSMMFTLGDSLIKKQNEYRELYLERKQYEIEVAAPRDGVIIAVENNAQGRQTASAWEAQGFTPPALVKKLTAEHRKAVHVHRRAQRYMEKRLLKNLWQEWGSVYGRQAGCEVEPVTTLSA